LQVKKRVAARPEWGIFRGIRFENFASKPFLWGDFFKLWCLKEAPIPFSGFTRATCCEARRAVETELIGDEVLALLASTAFALTVPLNLIELPVGP
jgi:hypothetical protein